MENLFDIKFNVGAVSVEKSIIFNPITILSKCTIVVSDVGLFDYLFVHQLLYLPMNRESL